MLFLLSALVGPTPQHKNNYMNLSSTAVFNYLNITALRGRSYVNSASTNSDFGNENVISVGGKMILAKEQYMSANEQMILTGEKVI